MILATGPTGSGKTTTLYAVLNKILTPKINVITLEDPVEYQIKGINQVQVKPKIGFSFAEGLRSILRQDPNIIMVGEIRDSETAGLATQSALTGHLVLSTLHTNSSSGALPRLVNMGVEPYLITSAVNAIVAQRLVRKLCQDCKIETKMPDAELEKINEIIKDKVKVDLKTTKFYDKGEGCDKCHDGFLGRVGLYEILVMTDKIEQATITNKPATEIETISRSEGMITLLQDGIIKVLKG
ncbi:MAG: General secretory pathway protein E, partial [uncultured bacterium]